MPLPNLSLDITQPYGFRSDLKDPFILDVMNDLTAWHWDRSDPYRNMVQRIFPSGLVAEKIADVPYIPVRIFKKLDLVSVNKTEVTKVLTSSGTTGQAVSRIYLDRETAMRQTRVLSAIMASFLGKKRWPMLIVDSSDLLNDRRSFNARVAGILGFSIYGRDHFHCLDGRLNLNIHALKAWLDRHSDSPVLIFGFTYIIWQGLYKAAKENNVSLRFPQGSLLIHGGGWKRLLDQSVSNDEFKARLIELFGIEQVHNYYGMVEQVGSIFMECEAGHLHCPNFAEVLVRDPYTFEPLPTGREGVIQVLSTIPLSYPGHSLLTEDVGTILGKDDCRCGRMGTYFSVSGRLPQVELRGCSDTRVIL